LIGRDHPSVIHYGLFVGAEAADPDPAPHRDTILAGTDTTVIKVPAVAGVNYGVGVENRVTVSERLSMTTRAGARGRACRLAVGRQSFDGCR
jgi:hypothetical protein